MKILFLGDIVGKAGCEIVRKNLPKIILEKKIDFCIVNGENAADQGVGIAEAISKELFSAGVMLSQPAIMFGIKKNCKLY